MTLQQQLELVENELLAPELVPDFIYLTDLLRINIEAVKQFKADILAVPVFEIVNADFNLPYIVNPNSPIGELLCEEEETNPSEIITI